MHEFCKAAYRRVGKQPLDRSEHHHLGCYEFIHVKVGDGTVLIRDRVYPLRRGGLYFIDAACPHCTDPQDNDSYERSVLIVKREFADAIFDVMGLGERMHDLFCRGGGFFSIDAGSDDAVDGEFRACADALENGSEHLRAIAASALTRITLAAITGTIGERVGTSTTARIIAYINAHLAEPLTVANIADSVSVNKYHLCHIFKDKTGMTVMQYILDRRLALAKEKLISTDAPILEIACECGFENPSHFSKVFMRCEGVSPREYRKRGGILPQ